MSIVVRLMSNQVSRVRLFILHTARMSYGLHLVLLREIDDRMSRQKGLQVLIIILSDRFKLKESYLS
jgi:hypothetical protein